MRRVGMSCGVTAVGPPRPWRCARAVSARFATTACRAAWGVTTAVPFGSTGLRRLSRLAVWWIRLGIGIQRIRPGHPEDNGSHEQFHRVLKAATARPPAATLRGQQRRFVAFQREYNRGRSHASLGPGIPEGSIVAPVVRESNGRSVPARCRVAATPILSGLHHEYRLERHAA
jgi:transposase InsO family protein